MTMGLSCIIPVYNTADYIETSVRSVLTQNIDDLEVIVVDDCSTDGSADIVERAFGDDPRVRLIRLKENTPGGAGAPSNIGIEAATKDYIAFLDSDDWFAEGYLGVLYNTIRQLKVDMVMSSYVNYDTNTHRRKAANDHDVWPFQFKKPCKVEPHKLLLLSPEPWRKIYNASFFGNPDVRFSVNGHFNEDYPFHWYCCVAARTAAICPHTGYHHRVKRAGQTTEKGSVRHKAFFDNSDLIVSFLNRRGKKIHWEYFQNWLVRHSWTIREHVTLGERTEYFKRYGALVRRIPFWGLETVLALRSTWGMALSYVNLRDGQHKAYFEVYNNRDYWSNVKMAIEVFRRAGLKSFLIIWAQHNPRLKWLCKSIEIKREF